MSEIEYRAVVTYATSGNATVSLTSDWLPHKDHAEEVIDDLGPFENTRGGWFDAKIEAKLQNGGE